MARPSPRRRGPRARPAGRPVDGVAGAVERQEARQVVDPEGGAAAVVVERVEHQGFGVRGVAEAEGVAELVGEELRGRLARAAAAVEEPLEAVLGDDVGVDDRVVAPPLDTSTRSQRNHGPPTASSPAPSNSPPISSSGSPNSTALVPSRPGQSGVGVGEAGVDQLDARVGIVGPRRERRLEPRRCRRRGARSGPGSGSARRRCRPRRRSRTSAAHVRRSRRIRGAAARCSRPGG